MRTWRQNTVATSTIIRSACSTLVLGLLVWSAPSLAHEPDCHKTNAGVTGDLNQVSGTGPAPKADPGRCVELQEEAMEIREELMKYIATADQITGINLGLLARIAEQASKEGKDPLLAMLPSQWNDIDVGKQLMLRAALEQIVRETRQALKEGRMPALLDPSDFEAAGSYTEMQDIIRLNQALQNRGLPQHFGGYSPRSAEDARGLAALGQGKLPDPKTQPTAFMAMLDSLRSNPNRDDLLDKAARTGRVPKVAQNRGIASAPANATDARQKLDELLDKKKTLEKELGAKGCAPILDDIEGLLNRLDRLLAQEASKLFERLGGSKGLLEPVTRPLQSSLTVGGHTIVLPVVPGTGPLTGTGGKGGGEEVEDSLVQTRDSANLIKGNASGYTFGNLVTQDLKSLLGMGTDPKGRPDMNPMPIDEIFDSRLADARRTAKVDRAAFVPAKNRCEYLLKEAHAAYSRALKEEGRTELTEAFDNTVLNRIVEATDVFGWTFKGDDPNNWIGSRSQRFLEQSENMTKEVERQIDNAILACLSNRHRNSMANIRRAVGVNDYHQDRNFDYAARASETELETAMALAFLPLTVVGIVDDVARVGRKITARAVSRTARLADDVAEVANDTSRVVRNLDSADEIASAARRSVGAADEAGQVKGLTRPYEPPKGRFRSYDEKLVWKKRGDKLPDIRTDPDGAWDVVQKKIDQSMDDAGLNRGTLPLDSLDDVRESGRRAGLEFKEDGNILGLGSQPDELKLDMIPDNMRVTGDQGVNMEKSMKPFWGDQKPKVIANDTAGRAAARRTVAVEEAIEQGATPSGRYSWQAWGDTQEEALQRMETWRAFYTNQAVQSYNPTAIQRARLFDAVIRWNF